ncbi:reprolysin-like metallopeptidase [Flavobacterium sp.]|uniref:zinc-dependent metalloprotease n=1 Tax=Flavobacterium sp. TaxID=239 RepID=UPI00248990CB|nr:T9SS type A sorting domain-containing protein [Flavobacterium sp.]MDI1318373.1 T9SS type A sorting domain-containing protein [Flavobacterium sp.]
MKKIYLLLFTLLVINTAFSQSKSIWKSVKESELASATKVKRNSFPRNFELFQLDLNALKASLATAPLRDSKGKSKLIIELPNAEGQLEHFRVVETPSMESGLAVKYPMMKTYAAQGIENPTAVARFSVTQLGLNSMTLSGEKSTVFIDAYTEDRNNYIVYSKSSLTKNGNDFACLTDQGVNLPSLNGANSKNSNATLSTDDKKLRTYRLAQSCVAEYGNIFAGAGSDAQKRANIQAQMLATITRVNGVYEKDLAITLIFIANNDQLIYYGNVNSDPWSGEYNTQTGITIDGTVGFDSYDIGHNFNIDGGGNAGCIGCVCGSNTDPASGNHKGTGMTGRDNPTGDPFDIDYVAHEMGHQFGGFHVQSSSGCRSGSGLTEVETGSGSSIMGYAGICPADVQSSSDDYFGYVNIRDISANVKTGVSSSCPIMTDFINNPPVANAGNDYVIPKSTAFILTGTASDPDGDAITYNWEQNDPQNPNSASAPVATRAAGPMFRTLPGTTSPTRYMPNLGTVLAGSTSNTWEVCPSVARDLNFSLTVRDNRAGGGQTASDLMKVTVNAVAGPFVITVPNTVISWGAGSTQNVTWNVAGTTANGVNTPYVDIYLSTDGGTSFPILLASKVPNDGSEIIAVPNNVGTQNRIMVKGYENIFYDVSNTNFSITAPTATFLAAFNGVAGEQNKPICTGSSAIYTINYTALTGFSGTTSFSATGNPTGSTVTFSPSSMTANGAITMTVSNTTSALPGFYTLAVTASSGATSKVINYYLELFNSNFPTMSLTSPANLATGIATTATVTWAANTNASFYDVQLANDASFAIVLNTVTTTATSFTFSGLNQANNYFWRVLPKNVSCSGTFSAPFKFTTGQLSCADFNSSNIPLTISATGTPTVNSTLNIPSGGTINSITVTMDITHTWINDLRAILISPAGTQINLFTNPCTSDDIQNVSATFDDNGTAVVCGVDPGISGVVIPVQALSGLVGQSSTGTWTLRIRDMFNQDGGVLNSWGLSICTVTTALAVNENALNNFVLYPNPNNGTFTIHFNADDSSPVDVEVFDLRGRVVYSKRYANQSLFNETINLDAIQSAIYLLKVKNGNQSVTKKIVIDK